MLTSISCSSTTTPIPDMIGPIRKLLTNDAGGLGPMFVIVEATLRPPVPPSNDNLPTYAM
ncbi:hypothetical protein PGT21_012101 [Puccinia graminis f. sp. tritici]|uniref:Uncharacterized protein n=1 Tax=Puccinia graminis f. sp. tritici TaxID=56615 RepID=A0A5B0PB69_PUCGR|nr:hypothetical protein PGT21_012101 [Puccinia graminis f. sp. tritici]KAA1134043.1 hypothetical protein PGTUg99_020645 [Puccinia graminis f. sp. tritici]